MDCMQVFEEVRDLLKLCELFMVFLSTLSTLLCTAADLFIIVIGRGCIDFFWTVSRTRRVIPRDLGGFLRMKACA